MLMGGRSTSDNFKRRFGDPAQTEVSYGAGKVKERSIGRNALTPYL